MQEKIKKHWFTDGKDEVLTINCPDGWHSGRAPVSEETKRKHRENNGIHKLTEEQKQDRIQKIKNYRDSLTEEQKSQISTNISKNRVGKGLGKTAWNKGLKSNTPAWNKGLKLSEERKQHLKNVYNNLSEEEKQRRKNLISSANIGKNPWNKGKTYTLPKELVLKAKAKEHETKKINNSFNKSNLEEEFYQSLIEIIGKSNVVRQHRDEVRYPFDCDFYIPLFDMFIEINGNWTHGKKPFNKEDKSCQKQLAEWLEKSKNSNYYKNAIYTWTDLDVRKQEYAKKYNLNYVSLYSQNDIINFLNEFDYRFKVLNQFKENGFPEFYCDDESCKAQFESLIKANCLNFNNNKRYCIKLINYMHKSLWKANKENHLSPYDAFNNLNLLNKSLENRIKYVGENLSVEDLVKGFTFSGIAPKISIFNPYLAKYIINKYLNTFNVIFDPCSGYSGRMLGACSLNKYYIGQDINETTIKESLEIKQLLNLNCDLTVKDLTKDVGEYDCLFTCPPYKNKENWGQEIECKSCDEWIDTILNNYKCKKYVFVVDDTQKYKDFIKETISNKSHLNSSNEYIIVIGEE